MNFKFLYTVCYTCGPIGNNMRGKEMLFYTYSGRLIVMFSDDTSPGVVNLEGKLIKLSVELLSLICHFINKCLLSGNCPQLWEESKTEALPKNGKADVSVSNCGIVSKCLLGLLGSLFNTFLPFIDCIKNVLCCYTYGMNLND